MNNGRNWKKPEKKDRKRKAANLMIIVDQFEEFFTNPENFYNEAPSQDSHLWGTPGTVTSCTMAMTLRPRLAGYKSVQSSP